MTNVSSEKAKLSRVLNLPQVVLYGLGTTIGAGIYALLGEIAGVSGYMAPWAFLTAAALALMTALSFARLVARYPRAAGAALYIESGFGSSRLGLASGILVIFAGLVSSAALVSGIVGYIQAVVAVDRHVIILGTTLIIGAIACWGINFSAWVAGLITLLEVGGLVWAASLASNTVIAEEIPLAPLWPTGFALTAPMILSGAVLAFYAFIGFEDMVEIAEEVQDVRTVLPLGILLTLALSTLLYLVLVSTAIIAVGPEYLAQSNAPLADLIERLSSADPLIMSAIGIFAILNGALIQLVMASRVLYGLANRGQIPHLLAQVNKFTQTPVIATLLCLSLIMILALTGRIDQLARSTSLIILVVFTLVNTALVLDEKKRPAPSRRAQIQGCLAALICTGLAAAAVIDLLAEAS